jgi:hypothetical protein
VTAGDIALAFRKYRKNCTTVDMILAEVSGDLVGYSRGWWIDESSSIFLSKHNGFLRPN